MTSSNAHSQFTVAILPLGDVPDRQIKFTEEVLEREFGVKTMVMAPKNTPAAHFNTERNRYQVSGLLDDLFFQLPKDAQRIIGVVDGLLEKKSQKRALGGALMNHRVAVYGTSTLPNQVDREIYSYPVIMHEFGHTLGLNHCSQPGCAMKPHLPGIELCAYCQRWANRELTVKLGSAEDCFSLAESYFFFNCLPQAVEAYREAIRRATHPEALYYYRLSEVLYLLEQPEETEKSLSLAVEHADDELYFAYTYGLIHLKYDNKESEKYFAEAINIARNPQNTHKLIGQAYREIKHDVEKASFHYKKYLQLGGNDQDVIDWLVSRSRMDQV